MGTSSRRDANRRADGQRLGTAEKAERDGHATEARQIADELRSTVPMLCEARMGSAVETWTSYCLLQARVLIAENLGGKAAIILLRLLDTLAAMGWRPSEALVSPLLSHAFEQCGASEKAITALEWHMKNIFEKLNVNSRIEAVQSVLGFKVGEGRGAM